MTPNTPSSTSSANQCTTAPPPNWPGAGPRSFSKSIWGEVHGGPHPEERPLGRVSKEERGGLSWFETALARLLTMRSGVPASRQRALLTPSHHGHVPDS